MGVFDRQRATATRLIDKYGDTCTWRQISPTEADPSKPWLGGSSNTVDHTVKIVFVTSSSSITQLIQAMSGTAIPTGGNTGYMATVNFTPSLNDTVIRSTGATYRIKSIDPLQINGEAVILYTMEFEE